MEKKPRPQRVRLIVNSILLLIALSGIGFPWKYWTCFFRGPLRVDDRYLLESANLSVRDGQLIEYVELPHRSVVETNWQREVSRKDKVLYADPFYVMDVADRLMLVHAESAGANQTIVGPLYRFGSSVEKDAYESLLREHPDWKERLLPVMINGKAAFRVIGYFGLVVLVPMLAIALFNITRAIAM